MGHRRRVMLERRPGHGSGTNGIGVGKLLMTHLAAMGGRPALATLAALTPPSPKRAPMNMNSADLNQLTTARADFGRFTPAGGQPVEFIELHLGFLHAGTHHTAPVLTLAPDQARTLAMALLAAADKARTSGKTPGSWSQ